MKKIICDAGKAFQDCAWRDSDDVCHYGKKCRHQQELNLKYLKKKLDELNKRIKENEPLLAELEKAREARKQSRKELDELKEKLGL